MVIVVVRIFYHSLEDDEEILYGQLIKEPCWIIEISGLQDDKQKKEHFLTALNESRVKNLGRLKESRNKTSLYANCITDSRLYGPQSFRPISVGVFYINTLELCGFRLIESLCNVDAKMDKQQEMIWTLEAQSSPREDENDHPISTD